MSNIPPSASSDSIQPNHSVESSSVTEEERQRILAGILAEEDDDSVSIPIGAASAAAVTVTTGAGGSNIKSNVVNVPADDKAGSSEHLSGNQSLSAQAQEHLPQKLLTARKRIESENAFSSSSEDEFDETNLEGIYGAASRMGAVADAVDSSSRVQHELSANASDDDTAQEVDLQQHFTWSRSAENEEEFRTNALNAMSQSIDANAVVSPRRRLQQGSFDRLTSHEEEGGNLNEDVEEQETAEFTSTAFSFESTAAKVAAAAARMAAAPVEEEESLSTQQKQHAETSVEVAQTPNDDYLAQAENQVLHEILNNDDETKEEGESVKVTQPSTPIQQQPKTQTKLRSKPIILTANPGSFTETPNPNNVASSSMMMLDASASTTLNTYYKNEEERESMRRAFQQCISAAVLVSLAHKRYERRRLAAMEIEKVVRSLVSQEDYNRVRAILLLLSDDYVRSTNEDARKGGVVALAACAIGLKKASVGKEVVECRDLILASVVHACQDHSQRVRYYATESLFNLTKVIPSLAVQHFFILFEILRSLYADVDLDVRSGAELLDKKLKEVIVGAINSGSFSADACVPVFARFVYMRNKATKQLTLTWLQEFGEKLIGAPILEFLHLFLGGIFVMVSDPNATIRQLALDFLQVRDYECRFSAMHYQGSFCWLLASPP
jgi:hypothetical protein